MFSQNVSLPLWLVMLVFIGWFLTLLVVGQHFRAKTQPWARWQKHEIFGIQWAWRWQGRHPHQITPYCPTDGTRLVYHFRPEMRDVLYRCESCDGEYGPFAGDHSYVLSMIGRQIERRATDGSWAAQAVSDGRGAAVAATVELGPELMVATDNQAVDSANITVSTNAGSGNADSDAAIESVTTR